MTVYGPYKRKDGRQHVIHHNSKTKSRRTQSYPRYLMEKHLGRNLEAWEHVDHINEDCTDNRLDNFQLLSLPQNNMKSRVHRGIKAEMGQFICPTCGAMFEMDMRQYRHNQISNKKSGPYCSKSCAGKMHH